MEAGKILMGVALMVVGAVLSFTFIGACIGLPVALLGFFVALSGAFAHDEQRVQAASVSGQGSVSCSKCGTANKREALFCVQCGRKFKWVCIHCGTPNSVLKNKFCEKCGLPRDSGAASEKVA